ncbi:hypothetical protein BZG02_06270 [Labilibaculum filiforme]|uniref:NADP-dependent oxidoreductase domain-containing protein n=1 Tax=Labilibaculum filiforme TaxID=1940526 RepID=A0A2N3I280_9BACT|nr:aldo/keto reductase [Labilibaculum filiforme]PKQ64415.1 hypothetical protein BZG02_06270 [Labilibaculum filiforme]
MDILSKIILGTVQFGLSYGINNHQGKPTYERVKEIFDFAFSKGIDLLDTAEIYGDSQVRIGTYHKGGENKFNVSTKFAPNRLDLPFDIEDRIKKDIEIIGVDSLESYMFHSYSDYISYYPTFRRGIIKLKDQGIINKVGVSLYTNEEIEQVIKDDTIDLIQLPFNLLDNSSQRKDVLQKAKLKGFDVHVRSVFLQGLFFKDIEGLNGNLIGLADPLIQLRLICNDSNIKINDLALHYVAQKEYIDKVLIGVENVCQLEVNLNSLKNIVPKTVLEQIDKIKVSNKFLLNPSNWNQ